MNKEQLHYFTLAYQMRNYSAAAKRVPMSPQGFAKSIHTLESELGVTLFTEKNGALSPTLYAEELLQFANTWDVNYQMMKESFRRIQAAERHEIRLGTSLGIIGFLGTGLIAGFHKKHPDISVTYNETSDSYCEVGLKRGTYDMAFSLAPYDRDFTTTELYRTQTYFWIHEKNPLSEKEQLSLDDLSGQKLAMPGEDFKIYHSILEACHAAGAEPADVMTSAEIFWLYEYAAKNKGLAFTLPHLARLSVFMNNPSITALPVEGIPWSFGVSYLSSRAMEPHMLTFIDYCREYAKKLDGRMV